MPGDALVHVVGVGNRRAAPLCSSQSGEGGGLRLVRNTVVMADSGTATSASAPPPPSTAATHDTSSENLDHMLSQFFVFHGDDPHRVMDALLDLLVCGR